MKKGSLDHIVVRTERLPKGSGKTNNFAGKSGKYITVLQHAGFNYKDTSVYLVRDIFGAEYTFCSSAIRAKYFGNRFYYPSSVTKRRHLSGIYFSMLRRCYDKDHNFYCYYGGKGIKVCEEWLGEKGLEQFVKWAASTGYEAGLTLDRTLSDVGYDPHNCSWMLHKENVRKSSSAILNYKKVAKIKKEFSKLKRVRGNQKKFFEKVANKTGCSFGTIKQLCYYNKSWN